MRIAACESGITTDCVSYVKYDPWILKLYLRIKKARFEYFILETYEAGLVLKGTEIKSVRMGGQISLQEAYVRTNGSEIWLVGGAHIAPYEHASAYQHDPNGIESCSCIKRDPQDLG